MRGISSVGRASALQAEGSSVRGRYTPKIYNRTPKPLEFIQCSNLDR